jgi:hypothetical protein
MADSGATAGGYGPAHRAERDGQLAELLAAIRAMHADVLGTAEDPPPGEVK